MKVGENMKEVAFMAETSKNGDHRGICCTCNNASTCTYSKNFELPVLQCEDFDDYTPTLEKMHERDILSPIDIKYENSSYKGLCSNCENYEGCTSFKPEGGIWHCEEYK